MRRELPYVGPRRREALAAPAKAARAAEVMRATLEDFHPDLVYVANSVAIPQAAPLAAAATGVPMAYRLSELFMASSLYTGDRYLRTLLPGQRGARGVWAQAMKLHNRRLGLQPSAPHRAGISWASNALREHVTLPASVEPALERTIHPASTQETAFAAIERAPADSPSVLYLGRMTTAKGIELAYRALAALRREHGIDARLVQVGTAKPEMVAALEALASELGVTDAIDDRGRLETEALSQVLAEAGVLVLPTVEWDVFPLVLIEAGLARVPIVAARIGGVPEAVVARASTLSCSSRVTPPRARLRSRTSSATPSPPPRARQRAYERMRGLSVARYREESERFVVETAEALA